MIFEKYCKYMCISLMIETPFKLNAFVVHCVYDIYIIYIYIYNKYEYEYEYIFF